MSVRVVAIRPGALGDALLALPALAWLRRARPGGRVLYVACEDALAVALASGLAEQTSPYGSPMWGALFANEPDATWPARALVQGADVVAWMRDTEGMVERSLRALGARRVVVAHGRPEPGERVHVTLLLARGLEPLGIAPPASLNELARVTPRLVAPEADQKRAGELWRALRLGEAAKPVVALHAGSGGAVKRWPPASFGGLAERMGALGATPLFVEGPQDAEVTHAALAAMAEPGRAGHHENIAVARGLSLGAVAALLARCGAYIGNDAGTTHLAALVGTPTLALFGPSDPEQWRPLGKHVRVLRSPTRDIRDITVEQAAAALGALLTKPARGQEESTSVLPAR